MLCDKCEERMCTSMLRDKCDERMCTWAAVSIQVRSPPFGQSRAVGNVILVHLCWHHRSCLSIIPITHIHTLLSSVRNDQLGHTKTVSVAKLVQNWWEILRSRAVCNSKNSRWGRQREVDEPSRWALLWGWDFIRGAPLSLACNYSDSSDEIHKSCCNCKRCRKDLRLSDATSACLIMYCKLCECH